LHFFGVEVRVSSEESSRAESITPKDLEESLSLKELIHAVRDELVASELERVQEGKRPLFEFDTLDIEVHFVVTKGRSAKGGFSLKVLPFVPFGADAQVTGDFQKQQVHKITLSLKATEGELAEDFLTEGDIAGRLPGRPRGGGRFDLGPKVHPEPP
jgi:hypothetical protein